MWLHFLPSILKQGRVTHREGKPREGEVDVDPEELLNREIAKDPWDRRLKPITADEKIMGGLPGWVLRSKQVNNNTFID